MEPPRSVFFFVQHRGITCRFSSKPFSENDFTKHDGAGDGGEKQPIVRSSRHTSFLREHKGTHTSGGIGDFCACGGSKVTYFRRGFIQYAIDLKPPSFPSLLGLADVWGSFLGSLGRQRATCSQCQPDFCGNSYERRITLHKETEPLSLPATFQLSFSYSPVSSSHSLHVIFGFFLSSLRLSPADLHPQITLCIK